MRSEPAGPWQHLDSAYEFNIWYWFKALAIPVMLLALRLVGAHGT
jgi:hypothetical protein